MRFSMIVGIGAGLAVVSSASGEHFDVYVSMDTMVRTGSVDVDDNTITSDVFAFGAELGEAPNPPGASDEPGFYADSLGANVGVGFHVFDALRVWDGSDFDSVAAPTMSISKGLSSTVTPAAPGGFAAGFVIATADGLGGFDDHPEFVISDPGATGVYLLTMRLWTDAPGVGISREVFFVFNNGADEAVHDAALEYVESIPAPGGVVVMAMGVVGGIVRRRR